MHSILLHTHSGLRWILLLLMIYVLIKDHSKTFNSPKKVDWTLMTFIIFSLQLILGIILYFTSPSVSFESGFMGVARLRFFTIEHTLGMIIAYHLVMIAYFKLRKIPQEKWNKTIRIYYGIALLVILLSIPWPFRGFGNHWF
ncbi:MAG: cytochrome B [Deltaproteobacteria bacterium]